MIPPMTTFSTRPRVYRDTPLDHGVVLSTAEVGTTPLPECQSSFLAPVLPSRAMVLLGRELTKLLGTSLLKQKGISVQIVGELVDIGELGDQSRFLVPKACLEDFPLESQPALLSDWRRRRTCTK